MGLPVVIMGESGSGKTYSLKNFSPDEVSIFSVEKQGLPFQKKLPMKKFVTYEDINKTLKGELKKKAYVIDDSQFLITNNIEDNPNNKNDFALYREAALNFRNLVRFVNKNLPEDVIVYFLHHTMTTNDGRIKMKTQGKMLDDIFTIEGCFDIVLLARVEGEEHFFETQSDGFTTAKSPEGMFEKRIPNDLKAVDMAIRRYYGYETNEKKGEK